MTVTVIEKIDRETGIPELFKIYHSSELAEREFERLNQPFEEWCAAIILREETIKKYQYENGFTEKWEEGTVMWRQICKDNVKNGLFENYHELSSKFREDGFATGPHNDAEWREVSPSIVLPDVGQEPDKYTIREFPIEV